MMTQNEERKTKKMMESCSHVVNVHKPHQEKNQYKSYFSLYPVEIIIMMHKQGANQ